MNLPVVSAPSYAAAHAAMADLLTKLELASYVVFPSFSFFLLIMFIRFIPIFQREEIDLPTAMLLSDDQFAELGLPIGKRLRLNSVREISFIWHLFT